MDVYYISDIHLECQVKIQEETIENIEAKIRKKLNEMVRGIQTEKSMLLIAGDISDSYVFTSFFIHLLKQYWKGKMFFVMGNHEIWDLTEPINPRQTLQEIIERYRQYNEGVFLHNDLVVQAKNGQSIVLNEETIISLDKTYLREICKGNLLILGGMGFSGYNSNFNALNGVYQNRLTLAEDIEQANRFHKLYEKISSVAAQEKCIILTHTPMDSWSQNPQYVPGWVYINGHTHKSVRQNIGGAWVYSNNQVGYNPSKWILLKITKPK